MSALAPVMEGFFTERLLGQRRASPHTVASYRDAFGLLLGFAQRRVGKAPSKLEDLDAVVIGAALDGVELQVEVAPVPETDFTTYLRELEAFDPELLVATGHPSGSGSITVQSADLGFEDVQVLGADSTLAEVVSGAADSAIGRYADFDCVDFESEEYQELARRYLEMSDNTFMDDDAVAGYGIVQMIAQAVREVGDDPVDIAEFLHGQTFDLPGYPFEMGWTEWGELATAQPLFTVIGEGPAPEGVNEAGEWYPERLILPDPLEPFEPG